MIDENKLDLLIEYYSAIVTNIKKFPLPGDFTGEKEDVVSALQELKAWRAARKMMEDRYNGSPNCYWVIIDDVLKMADEGVDNGCKN